MSSSREAALLTCYLRRPWDPQAASEAAAVVAGQDVDWEAFLQLADDESVRPLLYERLRDSSGVPEFVRTDCRAAYFVTAGKNVVMRSALRQLLGAFLAAGVPIVVLKGAMLIDTVYRNPGLRPMADLDLLIHHHDLDAAIRVAEALNFRLQSTEPHSGMTANYESEVVLERAGPPFAVILELHWGLVDSPHYLERLDMDWFWQTAEAATVADSPATVLGTEGLLLHLAAHLVLHHGYGSQPQRLWLQDVAMLLAERGEHVDWAEVAFRAAENDLVLPLQYVLRRLVDEWRSPVPPAALAAILDLAPSAAESRVFNWLTAPNRAAGRRLWHDLASLPSWPARLDFARQNLFPSALYMRQRYGLSGAWQLPFAYLYRWLLGLRGLARVPARPARHDRPPAMALGVADEELAPASAQLSEGGSRFGS